VEDASNPWKASFDEVGGKRVLAGRRRCKPLWPATWGVCRRLTWTQEGWQRRPGSRLRGARAARGESGGGWPVPRQRCCHPRPEMPVTAIWRCPTARRSSAETQWPSAVS